MADILGIGTSHSPLLSPAEDYPKHAAIDAILIYWGETIENNVLRMAEDAPLFWRTLWRD